MAFDPNSAVLEEETKPQFSFDAESATEDFEAEGAVEEIVKNQVSTLDYIINQSRLGRADSAVLGQALLDTFLIDPTKELVRRTTGLGEGADIPPFSAMQRLGSRVKELEQSASQVTGAQPGMEVPSTTAAVLGTGARVASDPLGYLGIKAVPEIISRGIGLFTIGGTSEVGGQVGEALEKSITGEDTGTGRAIGSITAAVKGAPIAASVQETLSSGGNVAKQIRDKYKMFKADPDAANQAYATGAAKRFLDIVAKEQGVDKLEDVVAEFNRISASINKENVPLMVAMADNPAVRQQVTRLAKTNPDFRNRVNLELNKVAENIDARAANIFGERYTPVAGIEQASVRNAIKMRQQIDQRIEDLSARLDTGVDEAALGKSITNLVDSRMKAATAEMKPVYDDILNQARQEGVTLPAESVGNIFKFVEANNIRNIFGRGTPLDKKIAQQWGPDKNGNFSPAVFDDVDSLKREINRLQRGSLTRDESRKLNQLEELVNAERRNIPGDYNQRLQDTDRLYYEKIGIPFSSQGIKDIDSKKYAEQVAPVLLKNQSSLSQFINAVGRDNADPIVRNAILSDAYAKSVKDGVVDPVSLRRYIQKNERILNQSPAARAALESAVIDRGILAVEAKTLDNAVKASEKRLADNFVTSVKDSAGQSVPNYDQLSRRLFTDPQFFQKIQKDLGDLDAKTSKAVKNNIRAEMINLARSNPDGGISFITDPKNAKVFNQVFGPGYVSAVKDLVKLSDAIKKADIGKISATIERSELDALGKVVPGLDIPFVTSTLRDRIASVPQKIVRLATRVNTTQLKDATDDALTELLLDTNGLKKLQQAAKTVDFNINNPTSINKLVNRISDILPIYIYSGAKTAVNEPVEPPQEEMMFGSFGEQ
jgi:hypothetical protein